MIRTLALCLLLSPTGAAQAVERPVPVDDFALVDQRGTFHQLSRYADQAAVVLFVQGNGCPIVRHAAPALSDLRERYAERGVTFLMLNPQTQDTRESIREEAREFGMGGFPILLDEAQLVAESLGVVRTAEVFVVDAEAMELRYRGPVDDRVNYESQKAEATHTYLADALDAILAGRPVERDAVPSPGCIVSFLSRAEHAKRSISYNEEIVPLLQRRCVACHSEGGIAPWAMSSYRVVRGWSGMMREVVMTRRMPPGQVDPAFEDALADLHLLTPEEEQLLVHWIDAGAPRGPDEAEFDALLDAAPPSAEWAYGEPDLVLKLPPQEIPATGTLEYVYAPLEIGHTEDLWVRALDFRPGDRQALHHLLAFIVEPGDDETERETWRLLGGYGPGKVAQTLPADTGRHLPIGTSLIVSLHYTTYGRKTTDATEIGLYLHDEPPTYRLLTHQASDWDFRIPPHDDDHAILAWTEPFPEDIHVHSFTPHMHLRGKRMRYTAYHPDREPRVLFSVPDFSFDWQMKYTLKEPILLPAGSHVVVDGAFDNSARKLTNPDPEATVGPGLESWNEMFIGYFNFTYARPWDRESD